MTTVVHVSEPVLGVSLRLVGNAEVVATARRVCEALARSAQPDGKSDPIDIRLPDVADEATVVAAITEAVVRASQTFTVHAGVVSNGAATIAIPGRSGAGKSTLTAALVVAGFRFVSDEVLSVDRESHDVFPFLRPLTLSAESMKLLGLSAAPPPGLDKGQVDPALLGTDMRDRTRLTHVVLARRGGTSMTVQDGTRAEAAAELIRRSFNHYVEPESSFRLVTSLAREVDVIRLDYQHAPAAAQALVALMAKAPTHPA